MLIDYLVWNSFEDRRRASACARVAARAIASRVGGAEARTERPLGEAGNVGGAGRRRSEAERPVDAGEQRLSGARPGIVTVRPAGRR